MSINHILQRIIDTTFPRFKIINLHISQIVQFMFQHYLDYTFLTKLCTNVHKNYFFIMDYERHSNRAQPCVQSLGGGKLVPLVQTSYQPH